MTTPQALAVLDRLYEQDAAERAAGLPSSQRRRNVDRDAGKFLYLLARATKAWSILEIGSSNGVSTIWLAMAAHEVGGHVVGLELREDRTREAQANLTAAGLANVASVRCTDALKAVATLEGLYDFVFIDAEKDDYAQHIRNVIDRVKPNGLIIADNVVSHDLSEYQAYVRGRPDLETLTLPAYRGLEISLKLRG
jgi:predicted O-methyltransferase YrrM